MYLNDRLRRKFYFFVNSWEPKCLVEVCLLLLANLIGKILYLLNCLFASNSTVEKVFSMSNVIKTDKLLLLSEESFEDCVLLNSCKILLTSFMAV